jgi:Holliday junction DNA helicase RuvB
LITAPLRSRFGIVHRLDFYEPADLLIIIHRSAKILNIQMDEGGGAEEIAGRCRGTPHRQPLVAAGAILRKCAQQRRITREVSAGSVQMLGVDECGLDEVDRNLMIALLDKYAGGPVGVGTLAAALRRRRRHRRRCMRPYLMQMGMMTPRARPRAARVRILRARSREAPAALVLSRLRLLN